MSHTTLTGVFLAFLIHVVILKDLVYVSIRTLYWVILSSSCLNQVTKNASKVILFNDLAYHFLKIPIQIISNGKFSHSILDTLFSLYFANNPKSILHQIPPFYVKQFSVLEYLYIFETHLYHEISNLKNFKWKIWSSFMIHFFPLIY